MDMYSATVDVARQVELDDDTVDQLMDKLGTYHPALGVSPTGWLSATISVPGETLAQATATALAVVAGALEADPVAVIVMSETERDTRAGWDTAPDLLSVTEAAEILGVSRQAVQQRIDSHSLPATRIGKGWAVPRAAVDPSHPDHPFTSKS